MPSHTSSKEARNKAVSKYVKENYTSVLLRFPKENGLKQQVDEHVKATGESVTAFIMRAIRETLENDKKNDQ